MALPNYFSCEEFTNAEKRIRAVDVVVTPIKRSTWLSELIEGNVYLKLEFFQPGNSFKLRGAANYLLSYLDQHKTLPTKVVTSSGEIQGIGVAAACKKLKIACEIYLPFYCYSEARRALFEDTYGAKVIISGETFQDSSSEAAEKGKEKGVCYIHPFNDPWVIQGHGTMYMEIKEQLKDVNIDAVLASVGGGGLLSGLIEAAHSFGNHHTDFYSVENKGADYYNQSHIQHKLVTLHDVHSIAQPGINTISQEILQRFEQHIKRPLVVEDVDVVECIFQTLDREKLLLDPSSASVVTALAKNPSLFKGKNVVLIISSANTTIEECIEWKRQFFPLEYSL